MKLDTESITYLIYVNSDSVWRSDDITPNMINKAIGEFDTELDALQALNRHKKHWQKLGYLPEWTFPCWI